MRRFVLGMGLTIAAIGLLGQNRAYGGDCGGAAANCGCNSKPSCPQCCCTVMQTCQETVYEYKEMTAYKVVYEDVEDKAMVPCVEYEPAPLPTCVPDTVLVPPTPSACKPANPCALALAGTGADEHLPQGDAGGLPPGQQGEACRQHARRRQAGAVPGHALHPARRDQAGAGDRLLLPHDVHLSLSPPLQRAGAGGQGCLRSPLRQVSLAWRGFEGSKSC